MPSPAASHSFGRTAFLSQLRPHAWVFGVIGAVGLALAVLVQIPVVKMALFGVGMTLSAFVVMVIAFGKRNSAETTGAFDAVRSFAFKDAAPCFIATSDGRVLDQNAAAAAGFDQNDPATLAGAFGQKISNPTGTLFRLQKRAQSSGTAQETVATRSAHYKIAVQELEEDIFVWRFETVAMKTVPRTVVEGTAPAMLMIGRNDTILYMNETARALVGSRVKSLDRIFTRVPVIPGQIASITTAQGEQKALVTELDMGAGRRALYLFPPPKDAHIEVSDGWEVFQDIPVPLIKVAPDGTVISFNKMASGLIGRRLETEAHLSELMEGLGRSIGDWLDDTLSGRLTQKSEFLRLVRTDREVFVQVTLNKISEGGTPALIAVLSDATELKSLEAQFVQSQKMQAIGQLAGGVAHDFNNLLTAISGHCDLLLLRHDQGDPHYSDLVQIHQNANRAAALVGQLLAFSRKQTLRPETLDMRDTLADLTHLLNRLVGERITLTLSHDPVTKPIRADKRQLEQVLMNLVVNARDAMPAGGEIKIVTECAELAEPLTRDRVTVPAGEYLTVEVTDDGSGIPNDKLQKVFEPFFTTKRTGEGTGLGLSTAYGIVKQSGGFIFVDSIEGSGTTFSLYFPILEVPAPRPTPSRATQPLTMSKHEDGIILLVEDEAPVRAFASRALRLRGYTVLEAESAEVALRMLEDESLSVDVFVTDVVMPGMDGPSWVKEALKDRPDVRVVFVSGYAEDSFDVTQTSIPNSVFLPKPFSLVDLTETVHRQLH